MAKKVPYSSSSVNIILTSLTAPSPHATQIVEEWFAYNRACDHRPALLLKRVPPAEPNGNTTVGQIHLQMARTLHASIYRPTS